MESYLESTGRILHGALAGMIGGAVASWVMNRYTAAQEQPVPRKSERLHKPERKRQQSKPDRGDDATVKTAQLISRRVFDHELTPHEKMVAGPAVHYAYGTLAGGLYGAVAEVWPLASAGFGATYGMTLWFLGDEAAVPAFRLGPLPTDIPARKHADYLATHIVYGVTLDLVRRVARHVI